MTTKKKNTYKEVIVDGEICIEFVSGGKYQENVLVDKKAWEDYLINHHWTVIKKNNYLSVITSINKLSTRLHRVIIEHEKLELDYWGNTIDHENNNPLDNRLKNLRIYTSKLNGTNVKSKYEIDNNHLIYKQKRSGTYKVHTNIFDEVIYKNCKTIEEARKYRDEYVLPYIEEQIVKMIKKTRNIEFERGLRDKLHNNEKEDVLTILKKYGISVNV